MSDFSFSSSPLKRSRDDYEILSSPIKRSQRHQIHSEAHLATVSLMMEASKHQKNSLKEEEPISEPESSYKQKAFWPEINRLRSTR
ncbi:hypothetical protein A9F13_21g00946 [Clavispora lusitaniae]|uniref:Uncharacterized protein n=1 Tax=Clavispora lusitaniae TaxID=36911 RepID=A0AA91SZX9_CLALS|nr:hypothetical protein E0198_001546 [Clavispora lusitaniae]OVF06263.1 hypothetical protein A9F13_21g00946 [Clavispora lusitaniae]